MHIVLCDDETLYLESIKQQILNWAGRTAHTEQLSVKVFRSSEDLLEAWSNGMIIDMLFLDIQIPGELSGMDVARQIRQRLEYVPIVFITNYAEYAYEGYQVNAIRYLRKPVQQKDIDTCMEIAWRQWNSAQSQFVYLVTQSQSVQVPIPAIIYAETILHVLRIITSDEIGSYEIRYPLDQLERKLPESSFVRCHRSFLISLRHVRKYKNGVVTLSSGAEVPVGRKYMKHFMDQYRFYYHGDDS